jgi:hypothetical protein
MKISATLTPPNSLFVIEDQLGGDIPDSMDNLLISATSSCIVIGCKAEDDGETEISVGSLIDVDTGEQAVFDGQVSTPSRKLVVRTVLGLTVLELTVLETKTRVRIWANDEMEPDRIGIGVV